MQLCRRRRALHWSSAAYAERSIGAPPPEPSSSIVAPPPALEYGDHGRVGALQHRRSSTSAICITGITSRFPVVVVVLTMAPLHVRYATSSDATEELRLLVPTAGV